MGKYDIKVSSSVSEANQRDIGGLGLTIVRKNADEIDYKYENNQNILSIEKIF